MNDISAIIQKLIKYRPEFAARGDFHLIHAWLSQGCIESDVIAAMDEMMGRNKNITSVAYFGPRVMRERDNRMDKQKAIASMPKPPEHTDERKAYNLRFKLKITGFLTTAQEEWLKAYEDKRA